MFTGTPRVLVALAAVITMGLVAPVARSASTLSATAIPGPTGPLEVSRKVVFARDVGISAPVGTKDYWLFGDTYIPSSTSAGTPALFIGGSTAAVSTKFTAGQSPADLQEIQLGSPQLVVLPTKFLQGSRVTYLPNASGVACAGGGAAGRSARWITGATEAPSRLAPASLFVTFETVCDQPLSSTVEGWGFALFDTTTNTWSNITDVFVPNRNGAALPERLRYGWPQFSADGDVTFFSQSCTRSSLVYLCHHTTMFTTSFPGTLNNLADKNRYVATTVQDFSYGMDAALFAIGRQTPSGPFYFLRLSDLGGNLELYQSTSARGPYVLLGTSSLPGCTNLDTSKFCYALAPHVELSTAKSLVVTYFVPRGNGQPEHLAAASVRLPVTPSSTTTTRPR